MVGKKIFGDVLFQIRECKLVDVAVVTIFEIGQYEPGT